MTDASQTPEPPSTLGQPVAASAGQPVAADQPDTATTSSYAKPSAPAPPAWPSAPEPDAAAADGGATTTADRPEIPIAGAFAGGFVLAMILKRLAR